MKKHTMKSVIKIVYNSILLALILQGYQIKAQDDQDPRVDPFIEDKSVFGWSDNRDPESPRPSPNAIVGLQLGFSRIMISYGSPAVKGREFGINLDHWESLWRTGANEGTTFTTTEDLLIEGKELKAGTYTILTIPREDEWTVIFNDNPKMWALNGYNSNQNVLKFNVPHKKTEELQERMTFYSEDIDTEKYTAKAVLRWEYFKISFSIKEV